jgi:hypothetical protein
MTPIRGKMVPMLDCLTKARICELNSTNYVPRILLAVLKSGSRAKYPGSNTHHCTKVLYSGTHKSGAEPSSPHARVVPVKIHGSDIFIMNCILQSTNECNLKNRVHLENLVGQVMAQYSIAPVRTNAAIHLRCMA